MWCSHTCMKLYPYLYLFLYLNLYLYLSMIYLYRYLYPLISNLQYTIYNLYLHLYIHLGNTFQYRHRWLSCWQFGHDVIIYTASQCSKTCGMTCLSIRHESEGWGSCLRQTTNPIPTHPSPMIVYAHWETIPTMLTPTIWLETYSNIQPKQSLICWTHMLRLYLLVAFKVT